MKKGKVRKRLSNGEIITNEKGHKEVWTWLSTEGSEKFECPLFADLAEHDIPITFGSDAHAMSHIGYQQEELREVAKAYGYKKCATFESRDRILVNF